MHAKHQMSSLNPEVVFFFFSLLLKANDKWKKKRRRETKGKAPKCFLEAAIQAQGAKKRREKKNIERKEIHQYINEPRS